MKIKVAVVTTSFPLTPDSSSGIFVFRLLKLLSNVGQLAVITPSDGTGVNTLSDINIGMIYTFRYAPRRLEILAHNPGGIPVILKKKKWALALVPFFLVSMFLKCVSVGRRVHVLHANWAICGFVTGIAGKLVNTPVITTLRGDDITRAKRSTIDRWLLKWCVRLSDSVVTVSDAINAWLMEAFPHEHTKISTIPNGVDEVFLKIGKARSFAEQSRGPRLLTVGSLIPRKGIDQIIRALALLKDAEYELHIVGDGPEENTLKTLAADHGIAKNIHFLGAVSPSEVQDLIASADIFVLASHSEGRPNVILEAMAGALPIIATNIDGVNELIMHEKTGLLFGDGDLDQLAGNIKLLISNPIKRAHLGGQAHQFIIENKLLWSETAARYEAIYQRLAKAKNLCAE